MKFRILMYTARINTERNLKKSAGVRDENGGPGVNNKKFNSVKILNLFTQKLILGPGDNLYL